MSEIELLTVGRISVDLYAEQLGVPLNEVRSFRKSVGGTATNVAVATAAFAGVFFAMRSTFDPTSGPTQLIYAFEAVVIGGIGSLWGTLVGGIVLGVAQTVGAAINPQYFALAGHIVFLVVLVVRATVESGGLRRVLGFGT